jgi:hypothetical protein
MNKTIKLLAFIFLTLIYSCFPVKIYTPKSEIYHVDYQLSVKLLEVKEGQEGSNNRVIISYEITNNSEFIFKDPKNKHYVFFTVKTEDGKEISDYEKIYKIINPHQSIISKKYIDLSTYQFIEVEAYIKN